jgi:hypothetical protein
MINQDFVRQTTSFHAPKRRGATIWRVLHTDPPLLVGILLLCGFGLFVLL